MTTTARVPVYADRLNPGIEELCFSGWSCHLSGFISDVWMFATVGIAVGLIIGTLLYLQSARSKLDQERSRTAAEREAFRKFANRIADLPANHQPSPSAMGGVTTLTTPIPTTNAIGDVKDAYRETVMAVPHYEEEYGETLTEHMAGEFGPDVATSVSTASEISPVLQRLLVSKARESATERDTLMRSLAREQRSLNEAEETFSEIYSALSAFHPDKLHECEYSALQDRWAELETHERVSTEALEARQEDIKKNPMRGNMDDDAPSFFEYVYQSLEVDFPVLATGSSILDQIQTSKSTVARIATTRN
jgi:hypothetical protein